MVRKPSRCHRRRSKPRGYADDISVDQIAGWQEQLLRSMETSHVELMSEIAEKKELSEDIEKKLSAAVETFNQTWGS